MKRWIVIGDIHGCYQELDDLLSKAEAAPDDSIISVGDLICRGPSSSKVLDKVMSLSNFKMVLGNHELRFLRYWRQGKIPQEKSYDLATVWEMSDRFNDYMKFLDRQPFYLEFQNFIVIHGGLRPEVTLPQQTPDDLTNLREVGDEKKPWYQFYQGPKPVIFGHWVRQRPLMIKNVIGLDTGCVYGGNLSACIFPDQKIISVPARKIYRERAKSWA